MAESINKSVSDSNPFKDLIDEIVTSDVGLSEIQSLILVHEHFDSSEVLLRCLIRHFKRSGSDEKQLLRIINFIKNWIKLDRSKFNNSSYNLGTILKAFTDKIPMKWRTILKVSLDDVQQEEDDDSDEIKTPIINLNRQEKFINADSDNILNYDHVEIAKQLVLIDLQFMKEVDTSELINTKWTKSDGAPGLDKCARRANAVVHWIIYEIISCGVKTRARVLNHIIMICQTLLRLQNYQSLMSIYLGLNSSAVKRFNLRSLLGNIRMEDSWNEIEMLFDYQGNFKNYRNKVKTLPMILNQEILLKDLLYTDETLNNFEVTEQSKLINKDKLKVMGTIIQQYMSCQKCTYDTCVYNPEISQYLLNINPNITIEYLEQLAANVESETTSSSQSSNNKVVPKASNSSSTISQIDSTHSHQSSSGNQIEGTHSHQSSSSNQIDMSDSDCTRSEGTGVRFSTDISSDDLRIQITKSNRELKEIERAKLRERKLQALGISSKSSVSNSAKATSDNKGRQSSASSVDEINLERPIEMKNSSSKKRIFAKSSMK